MDLYLGYRLLLLLLIIAANAYFSAVEVALLAVRPSRLRQMREDGVPGAQTAMDLLENPERMLSAGQVGVTIASLGLGWAGESTVHGLLFALFQGASAWVPEPVLHGVSFALAFLGISYVHVVIGEVVPKNIAMEKADRMAALLAPPLLVFIRLSGPFITFIERSSAHCSRLLGAHSGAHAPGTHNPEELKYIFSASRKHGLLDAFEEETMHRMLDLRDLTVREVMVPRTQFASVPITSALDEVLKAFSEAKYSRIPVYERDPENIHGIVYAKDMLEVWQQRLLANERRYPPLPFDLSRYLRKPLVVPETKPLPQLIEDFRRSHSHMALAVDEFGTVVGLVTLEDAMEQVFGEIEDEHDVRLPPLPVVWDVVELDGTTPIRDLETMYGIELPSQAGFETLAGFLMFKLGVIPECGATVEQGDRRFTVLEMDHNRVARVRISRIQDGDAALETIPA
ncbi:MAG: HlyC/CorC family transporter [Bryobacterales bacterium]|nr:HlyC/CorC family transporter [Bryobacterales bacterium]